MKNLKYILILVVLACSVTAYGSSKISIGISFQPAYQPAYIYRPVPVFQQPVVYYTCQQPVYVNRVSVYEQPGFSVSFSKFQGGGHSNNGGHRSHRDGGRDGGPGGGRGGGRSRR